MLRFFTSQAAGEGFICVSVIPCSKSQFFAWPLRFQAEYIIALTDSAQFLQRLSTGSPRCSVSTCLSRSCLLLVGGKIEANSIEATNCCDSIFSFVTTVNTTWHLIFESIPEVVRPWVTLSSHKRTAKLSGLSGFKPFAALNRNGMAKAARAGHTQRYAKLAAETAKHRKLQECKVLTWLLSDAKWPRLLYYPTLGMTTRATRVLQSG